MMRRLSVLSVLLFFLGCSASRTTTEPAGGPDSANSIPVDSDVRIGRLSNGLTYYIRANNRPENRAELRLAVNAGSILEDDDQRGLAHFTEHMAFNGTAHFEKEKLVDYLESIGMRMGADLNAYTSFDETVYSLTVPTDSAAQFHQGLQILRDWAADVSFDDEEIDKERGVVIEEWRQGRGAQARIRDRQLPILFSGSRYAERLPIGDRDLLEYFPHEAVKRFYRTWYRPELMAVVAVGDFDPAVVESEIQNLFSDIEKPANTHPRPVYDVPNHDETLYAIVGDPEASLGKIAVYFLRPREEAHTEADYRRRLVNSLYHGMVNNRLGELTQTADPPFVAGASGTSDLTRTRRAYILQSVVRDGDYERALAAVLTEAERVKRYGFTESELVREKKDLLRSIEQAYSERDKTESGSFAGDYVEHFLSGEPIPGIAYVYYAARRLLPGIGLTELNELADSYMTPTNRVVLVDGPDSDATLPSRSEIESVFDRVARTEIGPYDDATSDAPLVSGLPQPGTVVSERIDSLINVTRWTLSNGVNVVLKATDFKNNEILLSATSPGGTSLAPDSIYTPAVFAAGLIAQSGLGPLGPIELQKKLAGRVVRLSPGIRDRSEGFSGSAAPEDVETLFQLVYVYFTAARADSAAYQSFLQRLASVLSTFKENPESAFRDTVRVTMAQHHRRARPLSESTLNEMDLARSFSFFRDRYADASDFTFYLVGSFDPVEIKPLILRYLGALPGAHRVERAVDRGIRPPAGRVERAVYRGKEPKSRVQINLTGKAEWSNRNRRLLRTVTDILSIRLREILREDLGGVYGVNVSGAFSREPEQAYQVAITFGCDPARVDELTQTVYVEMDSLRTFGTTESYLNKAREATLRQHELGLRENGYWLGSLQFYDENGLDPDEIPAGATPFFESLSLDDVREAARRFLDEANTVRVVLYPEDFSH